MIIWSAQATTTRKSWPTNFPDDTIVWFQGPDRQMIPFDRVTGALRLHVKLSVEPKNATVSESQNNQVASAARGSLLVGCCGDAPAGLGTESGIYRIDMRKFLAWPLCPLRHGDQVPGCLLSRGKSL